MSMATLTCVNYTRCVVLIDGALISRDLEIMKREAIYSRIGSIIRSKRREKDSSQESLAKRLGLSRATLANMESGRQRILVHQLYALAEALSCKIEDFLPASHHESGPDSPLVFSESLSTQQRSQLERMIGAVQAPGTR